MTDIVPELMDKIQLEFTTIVNSDSAINRITNRIRDGTAELADGHAYAQRLGEILSEVLQKEITADILPHETLYYNIADRTVRPMLEQNHLIVNETASEIQKIIDQIDGIGINPVKGELPVNRIDGLIDKLSSGEEDALNYLQEPVVNCSESFFDDYVRANAAFRWGLGMRPTIERIASPGCCEWCANLAGTYDYFDLGMVSDVYKRHEYCRCIVTYQNWAIRQNVWSKEIWQAPKEVLTQRRLIGL